MGAGTNWETIARSVGSPARSEPAGAALGKVLVADDDDEFRSVVADILELEGWQVLTAKNGEEAVAKVEHEAPDVMLLDQRMPRMTGAEVVEELRRRKVWVPIVLITAAGSAERIAANLNLSHFLQKPCALDELRKMVRSASGASHS